MEIIPGQIHKFSTTYISDPWCQIIKNISDPLSFFNIVQVCRKFRDIGRFHVNNKKSEFSKQKSTYYIFKKRKSLHERYYVLPNGDIHGLYKSYRKDGSIENQFNYENGKLDGQASYFVKTKRTIFLHEVCIYSLGMLEGLHKTYYSNQSLNSIVMYRQGLREGLFQKFNPHNQLIEECTYVHDKRDGIHYKWTVVNGTRFLISQVQYLQGNKHGYSRKWNQTGRLIKNIQYNYGIKDK